MAGSVFNLIEGKNMMLGNLTIEEMEKRMGIKIPDGTVEFMNANHQDKAENIAKGKWHCFDIPFMLLCGDKSTAQKIYDGIKHLHKEIKQPLQICVQN